MSVRKRSWITSKGEEKTAWVVDYTDQKGRRHQLSFAKKKEADAYWATAKHEVRIGQHLSSSDSISIAEAGQKWQNKGVLDGLERTTLDQRRQHVELHIVPFIGTKTVSKLTPADVREFEDQLRRQGRSPAMRRKVTTSLSSIMSEMVETGLSVSNPVRQLRSNRKRGKERQSERRARTKLRVGVDIPTPAEMKAILGAAVGRWRPLLVTAALTGLRASEIRGLSWQDVDFARRVLHVRQRANAYSDIGQPKSESSQRTLPLSPELVRVLKEWKLAAPASDADDLVFGNGRGSPENHANVVNRGLIPACIAGIVVTKDGRAKYTGLHAFRHFYASMLINRRADGGLELPIKTVQERLGHASPTLTLSTYSHLFPIADAAGEMAALDRALLV